ncbi:MAG TPA: FHA domain-containing protein, partial [Bacteroidia bacterium]|nr:FHA domain-containing protein [Bacteroidia bacterium]
MSQADFSLVVCLPDGEPVSHKIEGDAATIGRSPENNIQILVAEVSVRHGSIVRDGEGFRIVDPGSTNGTKLNGTRVGPNGAALNPMDRLVFGTVVKAYFVPTAVLATTSPVELAASIEASADAAKSKQKKKKKAKKGPKQGPAGLK